MLTIFINNVVEYFIKQTILTFFNCVYLHTFLFVSKLTMLLFHHYFYFILLLVAQERLSVLLGLLFG